MILMLICIGCVKVYLKTKKMTNISQAQAGFKANSRRNPLWISRLFNAKSSCACRNRLNFRLFRYTLREKEFDSGLFLRRTLPHLWRVPAGPRLFLCGECAYGGQPEDPAGQVPQGAGGVPAADEYPHDQRHHAVGLRR